MNRSIPPTHARRTIIPDPDHEIGLAAHFRATQTAASLEELYSRFPGAGDFDAMMRRVIFRALVRRLGHGLRVGQGVYFSHLETFEIGDGVFIGDGAQLHGRFDGECLLGDHAWIGPQAFLDARALTMEEFTSIGPAGRILGSTHTGLPAEEPVMSTDLEIRPVRITRGASVGAGATVLPGVTLGEGSLVGAGSVVVADVRAGSIVAGIPAKFLRFR